MGQLDQLLGYLDRDGVTEVVLGVGRPIAMRNATGLTNLTARPLTIEQLTSVTRGTPIGAMIASGTATDEPVEVRIGARRAHVAVDHRGGDVTVRLLRADAGSTRAKSPTGARAKPVTISPRAKSPTSSPRAKSPTASHGRPSSEPGRAKSPTGAPRAKSPTNAPRAKSPSDGPRARPKTVPPSERAKTSTNTTRAKTPTNSPRAKSPTNSPRAKSPTYTRATTLTGTPSGLLPSLANLPRSPGGDPRLDGLATRPPAVDPRLEGLRSADPRLEGVRSGDPRLEGVRSGDRRLEGGAARGAGDPRVEGLPAGRASNDPRVEGLPTRAAHDPRLEGLPTRTAHDPRLEGLPAKASNDPRLDGLPTKSPADPRLGGLPTKSPADPRLQGLSAAANRSTMTMPASSRGPAAADTIGYDEGLDIGFVTSPASDAATGMPSQERRPIRLGSLSADLEDDDIDDLPPIRSRVPRAASLSHRDMSLELDDDKPSYAGGGRPPLATNASGPQALESKSSGGSQPMSLDLDDDNAAYTAMRNAAAGGGGQPTVGSSTRPRSLDLDDDNAAYTAMRNAAAAGHAAAMDAGVRMRPNAGSPARPMSLDLDDDDNAASPMSVDLDDAARPMSLDLDDDSASPELESPGRVTRDESPPVSVRIGRINAPAATQPSPASAPSPSPSPSPSLSPSPAPAPAPAPAPGPATAPPPQSVSNAVLSQRIATVTPHAFAALIKAARDRRASDLHVSAGRVTSVRVGVDLVPLDPGAQPLTADDAAALLLPLVDAGLRAQLDRLGYVDFALEAPGGGRLRANICRQQQGLKGTFRLALPTPLPLEAIGLPAELAKVVAHHQGLVVIAGPSGHGKTTTLAALVDLVNSTKPHHILTIEDPIELVHTRKQAVISQREVGRDTVSFARGLKASLREDPDVIVIGELRDRESVEIALTAAETGHLVLATMSTPSAAKTIDRLVDMFPPEEHSQVRASVAGALRAIVAQRLLPKKGGGVVPAIELVTGVLPLAVLIRDDKLYQLPNLMQRGRAFGMIRFDESLIELVRTGKIDEDTALAYAESRKEFAAQLQSKTAVMWKVPPK